MASRRPPPCSSLIAQFEALLKWLNKNGVRERKLLKKLQKSKVHAQPYVGASPLCAQDDLLEKIRSGPLQLFQERTGRSIVTTRSEACASPALQ